MRNLAIAALVTTGILTVGLSLYAKPAYYIKGKQVTKLQAIEAILQHKKVEKISKCEVELTSKATLRCVRRGSRW